MIRSDREITDFSHLVEVIAKCDVCRLALNDKDYPYILPLNFGYKVEGERITLFFHGAMAGHKHELIGKDNHASFEMDCEHTLFSDEERGYCTMNYRSVIGRGVIEYVESDAEKEEALTILTDRYHIEHFNYNKAAIPRTSVFKLTVESMTGKEKGFKK